MSRTNYQIYLMAMTELLINNNNKTDLGFYTLEYGQEIANIDNGKPISDPTLTLAVTARLVNNHTGKTEWGNIYYKSLVKTKNISNDEALNKLTSKLNAIRKLSCEDKIGFILKPENKLSESPYTESNLIDEKIVTFFKDLINNDNDTEPESKTLEKNICDTIHLNDKFPTHAIPYLNSAFSWVLTQNLDYPLTIQLIHHKTK